MNAAATSLLPMAENAYTLGLGRVDVVSDIKTDILVTLEIVGGPGSIEPYAGLVTFFPFAPLNSLSSVKSMDAKG